MEIQKLKKKVEENRENIIQFMRDICAIPSMEGQLKDVGERIAAEMTKLGFDEVRFDRWAISWGASARASGSSSTIRISTRWVWATRPPGIGILSRARWRTASCMPRGACDEKGSTPGMVYGLAFARDLGLLEGITAYYFGNMEEWCDGIAPNAFVEVDPEVRPDFVVIGEPTKMQVYRGHKGRIELKITASGRSAHAASHYLGDNAVYKMMAIITQIRELDRRMRFGMGYHPVQGYPSIAVTDVSARTASLNAVPDQFTIYIDRRITLERAAR